MEIILLRWFQSNSSTLNRTKVLHFPLDKTGPLGKDIDLIGSDYSLFIFNQRLAGPGNHISSTTPYSRPRLLPSSPPYINFNVTCHHI